MLTRDSRIGEIYATPIGHDIIHTLLLQTGLPEKAVANPVVRRLSLRALQKLAPGRLDDSLVDSLLGLLNHETQTPPAPTGGITRKWWKEAVAYQIYPRSFADSNGDAAPVFRPRNSVPQKWKTHFRNPAPAYMQMNQSSQPLQMPPLQPVRSCLPAPAPSKSPDS